MMQQILAEGVTLLPPSDPVFSAAEIRGPWGTEELRQGERGKLTFHFVPPQLKTAEAILSAARERPDLFLSLIHI